jgi:hypothetical protein
MDNTLTQIVSYYINKESKISHEISIEEILEIIKSGKEVKAQILLLRSETDKIQRDKLKGSLPMVTFSGLFGESRKLGNLLTYSKVLCIDIDKLIDLTKIRQLIDSDDYTLASFVSPSGNGLKVLIKANGNENDHVRLFIGIQDYYKEKYNIEIDRACKDVSRGAFLSYDPNIFININSEEWGLTNIIWGKLTKANSFLSQKIEYKDGNRNNYLFEFANLCKNQKIELIHCLEFALQNFIQDGFSNDEIEVTLNNVYANNYSTSISNQYNKENKVSSWDIAEEFIKQKYELRYNTILNKAEFKVLNSTDEFVDVNEDSVYRDMQKNNVSFSLNKLRSLLASDFIPNFDPFLSYFENLNSLNFDLNFDYIDYLASFVKTDDDNWFRIQFKKMLVRSVACALDSTVFNKQVFILVHSMQNSGKSTFCRFLCPPSLSDYFTENIGTDKDSLIALTNNFIVNMDELATLTRAEINTLKSMISRNTVNVRLPYGRRQINLPRRANFVGSTNKDEFLADETGSVRSLCFELIDIIDFTYREKVNIDFVWQQAFHLYKSKFIYELTPDEIEHNEFRNKKYQNTILEYDLIQEYFEPCNEKNKTNFKNSSGVLIYLKNQEVLKPLNLNQNNVNKALKMLGYKSESCYLEIFKQSRKGYFIKCIK